MIREKEILIRLIELYHELPSRYNDTVWKAITDVQNIMSEENRLCGHPSTEYICAKCDCWKSTFKREPVNTQ
jgi:hypothetical protein